MRNHAKIMNYKIFKHPMLTIAGVLTVYMIISRVIYGKLNTDVKLANDCSNNNNCPKSQTQSRLLAYCSMQSPMGLEGATFDGNHNWRLKHVSMTIRHGDRSSIHSIPGASVASFPLKSSYLDESAQLYAPRLAYFNLIMLDKHPGIFDLAGDHQSALNTTFQQPDNALLQGQLTTRGFMQHIDLGVHLGKAYKDLVGKTLQPSQVFIRSTNYPRTIQSAAALAMSMFPNIGGPVGTGSQFDLYAHASDEDEVMHGVGLRHSSREVGVAGEKASYGTCIRAGLLAKHQQQHVVVSEAVYDQMADVFGDDVRKRTMTDLADSALPSFCHSRPLPCSDEAHPQCMTQPLLQSVMKEADKVYCSRFTGDEGGREAAQLSTLPFLTEMVSTLRTAESGNSSAIFHIFSGHDTVIAPVLASLGVFTGDRCRWPGYASRIVFELWQPAASPPPQLSSSISYVRVLFNGDDVTQHVSACQGHLVPTGSESGRGLLCPLSIFESQLLRMISPHTTHSAACQTTR